MPFCCECGQEITRGEYSYSMDKFNRPLCREHQRMERAITKPIIERQKSTEIEKAIQPNTSKEEIEQEGLGWKNRLKKSAVTIGKGIVKCSKKLVDASKKSMQIRRWKDQILRRMNKGQLRSLCKEYRIATKTRKTEWKVDKRTDEWYTRDYTYVYKDDELITRIKNRVSLDNIIGFAKRNHINIRDILADIDKKKAEWKIKEINEMMEQEGRTFIKELEKSILEFNPPRKYYREEMPYQDTLATHLKNEFPDGDVGVEVSRGPVRPDIVVNEVAIEIKGPTGNKELETIANKCLLYDQYFHGGLICVLFNVYVNKRRYDAWLRGINNSYPNVIVIKK